MQFTIFIILLMTTLAASPAQSGAESISCTEEQAIAAAGADPDIAEFCGGPAWHGCDFKARIQPQDEANPDAYWLVTASIIHSFDHQGQPRFMPEGFMFADVSQECAVAVRSANVPHVSDVGSGDAGPDGCGNIGDVCSDGSVYAGLSPDGGGQMYTTPADAGLFTWNNGTSNWVDTPVKNCPGEPGDSCRTGQSKRKLLF